MFFACPLHSQFCNCVPNALFYNCLMRIFYIVLFFFALVLALLIWESVPRVGFLPKRIPNVLLIGENVGNSFSRPSVLLYIFSERNIGNIQLISNELHADPR